MANRKGTKGEDWSINIYKKKNPHTHTENTILSNTNLTI